MENLIVELDLTLFDGGEGGGSTQGTGGETPRLEGGEAVQPEQSGSDAAGEAPEETASQAEREKPVRMLVDGVYQDLSIQEAQSLLDRQLQQAKGLEEVLAAQRPILELLMERYGIVDGDVSKLAQAVERDETAWAQAAQEAGMTVEQYRQFSRMRRENEALRQAQRRQEAQRATQERLAAWSREAEEVRASYPEFQLETECRNPQFQSLLRSGIPMRHAYEVLHLEDIKGAVAQETEKNVVSGIRAKGARPVENGVSAQSGITIQSDVSKLTARDRRELARRAERGEYIQF